MKKVAISLLVLIIGVFMVSVTAANGVDDQGNPNDPHTNDRANACFEQGTLGNNRCDTTDVDEDGVITQFDVDWMWRCGWFLIRYEEGLIDRDYVPEGCKVAPPIQVYFEEAPDHATPEATPPVLCYSGATGEHIITNIPCYTPPPICPPTTPGCPGYFDPCAPFPYYDPRNPVDLTRSC